MGIDYRIVPDIDFFNEEVLVKTVYENCGGKWADIENDYKILYDAMNQPDGTMSLEDFTKEVRRIIVERGWNVMTKPYASKLGKELPTLLENQWDKLKHKGIDIIQETSVKEAVERLIQRLNECGIFPVKNGELESLFPNVGSHGPGYAISVMDKYPNLNLPEYDGLREVVSSWGLK